MAMLTHISVDSMDIMLDDKQQQHQQEQEQIVAVEQQQQNNCIKNGSDSGLDTASLSNTSYELLRGISLNSTEQEEEEFNITSINFEKMNLSSTPTRNATGKNLQRAASLSRAQRVNVKSNELQLQSQSQSSQMSKSLVRQSQSLQSSSNTRSLQRTPSLARTRQLSMPRVVATPTTDKRRLSSVNNGMATLPRSCRQKSVDDLSSQNSRSSSSSRMYNSMLSTTRKNAMSSTRTAARKHTTIYHETATQTALTQDCLEQLLAGKVLPSTAYSCEQHTQTYARDEQLETLQAERKQRQIIEQRLLNLSNLAMVCLPVSRSNVSAGAVHDVNAAMLLLESLISLSGCELKERQEECVQMRTYCRKLQDSLQQSMATQQNLVQEHKEQVDLLEFREHELEAHMQELAHYNQAQLEERNAEIRILRGECCHLVRLNEQRRQENSLMLTRYKALETRQKNILCMNNAVVMQALNAVAELYTRLDNLFQHLITAYNIGEIEQWDELINGQESSNCTPAANKCTLLALNLRLPLHATTTCNTNNKEDLSPECNRSFIAAIIEAIRNATTPARKRSNSSNSKDVSHQQKQQQPQIQQQQQQQQQTSESIINFDGFVNTGTLELDESDSTEMLDSETEPCLMMDNVLEDVTLPDSHSHNMVSSTHMDLQQQQNDESLQNLSQAIVNRQQAELQALR